MENSTINYLIISEEVLNFQNKEYKIYDNCPTYFKFYSLCKKHFIVLILILVYKMLLRYLVNKIFGYGYVERDINLK